MHCTAIDWWYDDADDTMTINDRGSDDDDRTMVVVYLQRCTNNTAS